MKNNFVLLMVLFLPQFSLLAQSDQPQFLDNFKDFKKIPHGVSVSADNAKMAITAYSPTLIRIRIDKKDFSEDFSYAVIRQPEGNFTKMETVNDTIVLYTDSLQVFIQKEPIRIIIKNKEGKVLSEDYQPFGTGWLGTEVTAYKKLFPDEKFIGLGEKTGPLNRRGEKYENWNSDIPAYTEKTDPLYVTIPFFMGIHDHLTYGIFLDNSYRTKFNFGASTDDLFSSFSAANGEMNYYFIGGSTIARIIEDYTWLTGRMNLPPYWSLGYQQCRWGYYPESEVMSLAQKFRDKKIPCDVIYLDIDYMDGYKIFTWNKDRFPQPKQMITKLNSMGFHVATIVDPGIKVEDGYFAYEEGKKNDLFVKYPTGQNYTGSVWPGRVHFPDFTKESTRIWWGNSFTHLTEPGVEGFWNDMNEPSAWGQDIPDIVQFDFDGHKATLAKTHNVYGLNMSRATFEGTKKLLNKRPFVLTRAAYAGIQRYSAVWTGDNVASDDHMLLSARLVNSMGLSGLSFVGPDMGGFIGEPSKELYERWLSLGVFTPFFRNHSAVDTKDKEPWSFGEDAERFSVSLISMRYRLLPYIYSMFNQSVLTGLPVARSLAIDNTFDEKVYWGIYMQEYMFGDNFLIAPVSCDQQFTKVYLPEGNWYRFTTGEKYSENSEVIVPAPLDDLPVFVKASGIIPLQSVIQYTAQKPSSTLELHIYNGTKSNVFTYYEDDGESYQYEQGNYYKRTITFDPSDKAIIFSKTEGSFKSKFSSVKLILHDFDDFMSMNINGMDKTMKLITHKDKMTEFDLIDNEIKIIY